MSLTGAVVLITLGAASTAAGVRGPTPWVACSKASGDAAARQAGFSRALDGDPLLRQIFSGPGDPASGVYRAPTTSLCGDFNGDGRPDRAVFYQCCTGSSPAPWVVLQGERSGWRIVYARLHDTTFKLEGKGTTLVTTEPQYSKTDATCCPSRLRIGSLRWTGRAFRRTFRVEAAPHSAAPG